MNGREGAKEVKQWTAAPRLLDLWDRHVETVQGHGNHAVKANEIDEFYCAKEACIRAAIDEGPREATT